jgi:DNA polymerase-1
MRSMSDRKSILIVDGTNHFIRCFERVGTIDMNGHHTGGVGGALKSLAYITREIAKPSEIIMVFDGKYNTKRRVKLFEDYKSGRKTPREKFNRVYIDDTGNEVDSMRMQFQRFLDVLDLLPVSVVRYPNFEADDIIAKLALDYSEDHDVIISSTDKDFVQLVGENVKIYNRTLYGVDEVLERYSIHPRNFLLARALSGDASDSIPGLPRVGMKTLVNRFPEFASQESIDYNFVVTQSMQRMSEGSKLMLYENITKEGADKIVERNLALMQLHETALQSKDIIRLRKIIKDSRGQFYPTQLLVMLNDCGLNTIVKNPQLWLHNSFSKVGK